MKICETIIKKDDYGGKMDIAELAGQIGPWLLPVLPRLLKAGKILGKGTLEAISEKIGEAAMEKVAKIWKKLAPSIDEHPEIKQDLERIVQNPDDEDAQVIARFTIEKLLEQMQPEEVIEIGKIVTENKLEIKSKTIIASGDGAVAMDDGRGANINTGDTYNAGKKEEGPKD